MLRRWIEACYGTASAEALAAHALIFPTDLLADILAGQRDKPATRTHHDGVKTPPASADTADTASGRGETVVPLHRGPGYAEHTVARAGVSDAVF